MRDFGPKPILASISKTKLVIDSRYQRDTGSRKSQSLIKYITENFNWIQFGVLSITDNGDGTYCVLDGQHRWNGVMEIKEIDEVPCLIGDAETLKDQARAFVELNTKRITVTPLALYHARLRAGDKDSIALDRIITKAGCMVPRTTGPTDQMNNGEVICLNVVKKCVRLCGEDITVKGLAMIKRVWPDDGGVRGEIVTAICNVLQMNLIAYTVLDDVLKSRTPEHILGQAYVRRAQNEESKRETLTKHIVKLLVGYATPAKLRQKAS